MRESTELTDLKRLVEKGDLLSFQGYVLDIIQQYDAPSVEWDYLFQKVYLHACLKKKANIAKWLEVECFPKLPEIQQIAIRQVFPYGRHLLAKRA
jgi:hypothetical protein